MRVWKATMPEGAFYGQEGRIQEWSREILSIGLKAAETMAIQTSRSHLEVIKSTLEQFEGVT